MVGSCPEPCVSGSGSTDWTYLSMKKEGKSRKDGWREGRYSCAGTLRAWHSATFGDVEVGAATSGMVFGRVR
jgi:hypothetical protein